MKKVKIGNDQEMAQSERNHHSKNRSGKKLNKQSGTSCSKLTTSLVNVSLKFQKLILQIHCYFLLKKKM